MAKTLAQIHAAIARLQEEAATIRAKEVAGVVARIKEAIEHYELTPADLFGASAPAPRQGTARKPAAKKRAPKARPTAAAPRYRDEATGRTWTGVGKRPNWFKAALEAGKTAAELEIKA